MLKHIAIGITLLILGTSGAGAQGRGIVLRKMEVQGADFDIVVAMSKTQADGSGHSGQEGSLVAGPTGDWLAFATDGDIERIFGNGRSVVHAFRVERKEGEPSSVVHVYIVAKGTKTPSR
jgi:hypothetical protein